MQITLKPNSQPYRSPRCPTISVSGLVITIDGEDYDLSQIPEGGEAEADENSPFIGKITRESVSIRYPYDQSRAALDQPSDPSAYVFDVDSGEVPCPIIWRDA